MSNILEEMETESIKTEAADSLGDAQEQLKQLILLEHIQLAAVAGIVGISVVAGWPWVIPLAGLAAATTIFKPQTAAAHKLDAQQRKHLKLLVWAQCLQGSLPLFIALAIFAWGMGARNGTPLVVMTLVFIIYRAVRKIRVYKKTMKHVAAQQNNLAN